MTAASRVRKLVESAGSSVPKREERPRPGARWNSILAVRAARDRRGAPPVGELPVLRFADEKEKVRAPRVGMKGKLLIAGGVGPRS